MTESNGQDRPGGAAVRATDGPAEWFLNGVRAALADLPAAEVDDILGDVRAHLADLAAELGSAFDRDAVVERLGTPADYAAELRSAAGYPPAPPASVDRKRGAARAAVLALLASTLVIAAGTLNSEPTVVLLGAALVLIALPALVQEGPRMPTVAALPEVRWFLAAAPRPGTPGRALADFLASLQPAWWIARALLAAFLATAVLASASDAVVTLVLAVLAIPLSVWLGRLSGRDRRLLWVVVPLNGLAVALLLLVGYAPFQQLSVMADPPIPASYGPSGLWQDGEREILDIYPYDASGTPLSGVYLYDQDGNPISTSGGGGVWCGPAGAEPGWAPSGPAEPLPYPRGTTLIDGSEVCVMGSPPFVVPVPPTPALTPTPQATSTAPGADQGSTTVSTPPPPTPTG